MQHSNSLQAGIRLALRRGPGIFGLALLSVVTLELCARTDDWLCYRAPFGGPYSPERLRTVDEEGLQRNVPGARYEKWQNNSAGFRGDEIAVTRRPGTARVACMGTSETYGLYESPGKEWPAQLADSLAGARGVEVMNASVVGLRLGKYQRYIQRYVSPYKPDVIVLVINPFVYATTTLNEGQSSDAMPSARSQAGEIVTMRGEGGVLSWLRVYPKMRQTGKSLLPRRVVERYLLRRARNRMHAVQLRRLGGSSPMDTVPDSLVVRYVEDIRTLADILQQGGMRVVLSTYPCLYTPDNMFENQEFLLNHRRFFVEFSEAGLLDILKRFSGATRSLAAEEALPLVDADRAIPRTRDYFADGVHLTDLGASRMAGIVARIVGPLLQQRVAKESLAAKSSVASIPN